VALVNFAAVADVVEIYASEFCVKFIEDAVITHAQFEFLTALQSLVRESVQPGTHFIHLALDGDTD